MSDNTNVTEPVVIPIAGKLDENSLHTISQKFDEFKKEAPKLDVIGNLPDVIQPMFKSLIATIENQKKNVSKALTSMIDGKAIGEAVNKSLLESVGFLGANVKTASAIGNAFTKIMSSIPKDMHKAFNAELSDMIRSSSNLLHQYGFQSRLGPRSDSSMANYLQKNSSFAKGFEAFTKQFSLPANIQKDLISSLVKIAVPSYNRADYIAAARAGAFGQLKNINNIPQLSSYKERLPERFRSLPDVPRMSTRRQINETASLRGNLTPAEYVTVKRLAANNKTWEQALTMAGVATRTVHNNGNRSSAGTLMMPGKPISKAEYAIALGFMDNIFRRGLEGAPMWRHPLTDTEQRSQYAVANKTSRIATEGYSAFDALKGININPVYMRAPSRQKYNYDPRQSVAITKASLSVRPDMYQIQSLTLDDFRKGVILDSNAPKQSFYDENAAGQSTQKMISRSAYTHMLGMRGHNTFGNGSLTNNSRPIVMQLDLSKELFETKDGKLVYGKNGLPMQNAETKKLIEQIFSPNATLVSAKGEEYHYPTIPFGDKGRYVPTNVKNGLIWLAEEGAYRKASQKFIDKFGANAFDNLLREDAVYFSEKDLNKGIEARNRDLTPSVPFSELGGRLPNRRKMGFADFNYITGLDGGAIAMPGYIPGEAGTVRGISFKGTAMTADYKRAYRDIYGENAQWFVPFMNAPESIKKLYKEEGIDAVRKAYNNPNIRASMGLGNSPAMFNEHFFDMMNMDFVADKSMFKTSFYDKMSLKDMQDAFVEVNDLVGGLGMVQTAKEFLTKSSSLSKQVAQSLDLTPQDLEANREQWDKYIHDLRYNPLKAIEYLFSDQSIPLNQRIKENPSLMWQIPEARNKIEEAIASAENDRQYNKIFAKGDLVNALALPNIGELMLAGGKANRLKIQNQSLANIWSLTGASGQGTIAFAPWVKTGEMAGFRFPNNVTEQYALENNKDYIDFLNKYQMSRDAIYLNMATIAQMGGGDVDGDTVSLAKKRLYAIMKRSQEQRTKAIGDYTPNLALTNAADFSPRAADVSDFSNMMYRTAAARFLMAAVSNASDALAQGDWNDPNWVKNVGRAGYDLKAMYDIDSTYMKTGIASQWTTHAQNAKDMGRPFAAIFKDLIGAVNENDYSKMVDFTKVNYPSIYSGLTVSALDSLRTNPLSNQAINRMIEAQEALKGIDSLSKSSRPADKAYAKYLQKNNSIFANYLTRGAVPGQTDVDESDVLLAAWGHEIAEGLKLPNLSQKEREYYNEQLLEYNRQISRAQHRDLFGITMPNIAAEKGYAGAGFLKTAPLTGQNTIFSSAFNNEEDRLRLQRAIAVGANDTILEGVYKAGENEAFRRKVAESKAKADNDFLYSWSFLHQLETGSTEDLKRWYQEQIDPGKRIPIDKKEVAMGLSASKLLQEYAAFAIENNQARGTSEQWENRIKEILQTEHGNFFSTLPGANNSTDFTKQQTTTYNNLLAFARALPTMFAGEKILGAEVEVAPLFGNKVSQPNVPVRSLGKIDLQTQNMNGEIINTEMKPYLNYPFLWDQVNLYNPERNAKYVRALSYGETSNYSDPANYMITRPYSEEEMKKVEARMQNIVKHVQGYAETGFDPALLFQMFSPLQIDKKGNYLNANPNPGHISEMIALGRQAGEYYTNVNRSGYTIVGGSLKPDTLKETATGEFIDPRTEAKQEDLYKEDRALLAKKTGQSMAKAMSLETDIREYEKELEEITEKLFSKEYRAGKIEEGTTKTFNPWVAYERQLQDNYLRRYEEFKARGATNSDLNRLDMANLDAIEQYEKALRASASADFIDLTNNIDNKIQAHGTSSSARSFAKEFDDLTESIDRASQAYNKLVQDLSEQAQENVTSDNIISLVEKGLLSQEDADAFLKAEKARKESDRKAEEYRNILREDANINMQDRLDDFIQKATGRPLSQEEKIDKQARRFKNEIDKYSRDIDLLENKGVLNSEDAKRYRDAIANVSSEDFKNEALAEMQRRQMLQDEQQQIKYDQFMRQGNALRLNPYGTRRDFYYRGIQQRNQIISQLENRKLNADAMISEKEAKLSGLQVGSDEYNKTAQEIANLKSESAQAQQQIESLSGSFGTAAAVAAQLGTSVQRVATMLGRRLFRAALQETKKFIKEFDASMNEIQTITLKSDEEMQGIRSQTINKALGLRTSVSNVATTEAALYRQGLSDAEVSSRTESIIKFATVTKLNVSEATKIITTALQNDLVPSAEAAMDALVALGDSAATTAAEIGKGMQKAAASAKVAGVSYAELTALLTIGTSDTQLSGTQVGTALQTVFTRMRRLSLSGYTADQNGKKTTASDAEAALRAVGIDLYDDKTLGKMRNAFDIMKDLSKVWQNLSDTQKSIVTSALAGTRQTNIFSTLMEGMSEDNGETLEKYLGLAEGSEGITQTKYEIAMQSLAAAMDELRSSWDAVVESFVNSGTITGALDYVSSFLQTIAGAGNIGQNFSVIIGGITGITAALLALKSSNPILAALSTVIGVIAGIATTGGIAKFSSLFNSPEIKEYEQQLEKDNSHISDYNKAIEQQKELISNVEKYGEAWQKVNNIENEDNLKNALNNLKIAFPELSGEIQKAIANLSQWKDIVDAAKDSSDNFASGRKDNIAKDFASYVSAYGETVTDEIYGKYFTNQVAQQEAREKFEYYKASSGYATPLDLYRHTASGASNAFNDYVDSILKARGINGDEIRNGTIERNDPQLYKEINSLLEMGLYSGTSKETNAAFAIKQNKEQVDKFWDGLITNNGEINERIYNKTGTDKLKYQLLSTLFGNSADLREEIKESNPDLYKALFSVGEGYGYGTYYGAITEGANEDEFRMAAEFMDELVNRQSELGNAAARKRASNEAIEKMIADRDLSTFVTENVSEDVFKAALKTSIGKAIDADYEKYHIGDEYNWTEIGRLINEILSETRTVEQITGFAETYADDLYYKYKVGDQGYADLDSARKAIEASNGKYSLADLVNYKDNTPVYPSVDQLVSAQRQEANANNRKVAINDILYGYNDVSGFHLMTEQERRDYVGKKQRGIDAQNLYRELTKGNLAPALSEIGSIDELKRIYSGDLAPVLNNVITGNGVAAAAMLLGDIDLFRQALANEDNGIIMSESDMMESVINALRTNNDFVGSFRTDEYLSGARDKFASFFGSNSELILNALANGTYDSDDALKAYVASVLASRKIKAGTGLRQFTNVETAKLAEQVLGIGSWTEAQAKSNELGWTTDEWSVIESKYPDLKRYLLMSDKQKTSQEGQNILRDVKIQMSIAGVSDLENANKVLEGTTQLIENLQKGGTIEFKAKLDFENQLYSNQQQEALLENGTYEEQVEAIMALTGRSKTQVQNDFIGSKNSARSVVAGQRAQTAASFRELQKTNPELAARLASMFGFSNNGLGMSIDDALDEINKFFGYEGNDKYQYNAATDELYRYGDGILGGRYRFVASSAARERFEKNIGTYNYRGSTVQPDREDVVAGTRRNYTQSELVRAQMAMYQDELRPDIDNDLYKAAYQSMGVHGRNFLGMLEENDAQYKIDKTTKYTKEQIDREQRLEYQENATALREAEEQEDLENARLLAGASFEDASRYAALLYRQNNKGGFAADALYQSLNTLRESGQYNLENVVDFFTGDNLDNWKELVESAPDLTKAFKDMGHAVKEDGTIDWSAIEEETGGLDQALADLISVIASHSVNFQNVDYKTRSEILTNAQSYNPTSASGFYNDYASIVGQDIAARRASGKMTDIDEYYANLLMSNYEKGINGLTLEQQTQEARKIYDSILNGEYENTYGKASQDVTNTIVGQIKGLQELIDEYNKGNIETEEFAKRTKDVEAALNAAEFSAENYGETVDETSKYLENLSAGGTKAIKTVGQLKTRMSQLNNVAESINKARGNSGKRLTSEQRSDLASVTGESEAVIKEMSAEEISNLADNAQQIINEEFTDTIAPLFQDKLNKILSENHITGNMLVDMGIDVGDGLDTSEMSSLFAAYNADAYAELASYAGKIGELIYEITGDQDSVNLVAKLIKGTVSGSGSRIGGGGGGGGKSAVDKLLEDQKHKVSAIEHENKMLDIQKKYQDLTNDSTGYNSTVDEQIKLQEKLRQTYIDNINELEEMLKKTTENSDDWWKLKDAISAAQESLASINNTIQEYNSEKINNLLQSQENEDKFGNHKGNILDKMAQRYQTVGDFSSYESVVKKQIDLRKEQIETNNKQIAEQEALLAQMIEGSDAWLNLRDKIWETKEENAELENQVLSSEIELERSRLAQLSTEFNRSTSPLDHSNNMLNTYGGMYERLENYEGYREALRGQNENNELKLSETRRTIDLIKEQMSSIEEGSEAWFDARDALYQYEEIEAQLNSTILENNQAIGESKVQEYALKLAEATQHLDYELNMLQAAGQEFEKEGNLVSYEATIGNRISITTEKLETQISALDEMKEALDDPEISDSAYKELVKQIEDTEQAVQSTTIDLKELNREANKAALSILNESFEYGSDKYKNGDTELQHNIQMAQYLETKYQNSKELTNLNKMIVAENELQKERAVNIANHIKDLENQRDAIEDDEAAVKEIESQIYKWEEELAKTNNTIEKNEEALKQNATQILKTRQAVENQLDQEIRNRIQEEKDRLSATISVENTIIETIRKNKREEWELEKKTIQKQKEALNEEKNLLNERVQARKNAVDTEEKYEELARLKSQLSIIQADASRTREAKELAKQIADIEKDLAWQITDEQASATSEMIDSKINGWDQYMAQEEEYLSEYLENTANFREKLDEILNGTVEDFLDFMHENSEEYKNSTFEMQTQMDQSWKDTFNSMKGEIETYWNEVDENMRTREGFIDFMKQSSQYEKASSTGKSILESGWGDMYDAFIAAYKDNAEFDHDHENDILNKVDELKEVTFKVDFDTQRETLVDIGYAVGQIYEIIKGQAEDVNVTDDYAGIGTTASTGNNSGGSGRSGNSGSGNGTGTGEKYGYKFVFNGHEYSSGKIYPTKEEAIHAGRNAIDTVTGELISKPGYSSIEVGYLNSDANRSLKAYLNGGLVDYTGLAMVHGSKTEPEAFINSSDRKTIRAMLDAYSYITSPFMSHVDMSKYGNNFSYGDITVTINEAKISSDQDIAELAKKVGSAFTKELTKSGYNIIKY